MKQKWQKSRNYRRFKNENGEVVDMETGDEEALEIPQEDKAGPDRDL